MRAVKAGFATRVAVVALALAHVAGGARADWTYQAGPEEGRHAGFVCAEGTGERSGERLCFGLSCNAGSALAFGMSAEGAADLLARSEVDVQIFAGPRVLAPLRFHTIGLGTFEAPLEEAHLPGLERLKAGARMELRYWEAYDAPPAVWSFPLTGSRTTIETLEQVCPMPDFAAQERAARTEADPGATVLADMREACAVLGGEVTVGAGYTTPIDLDGAGAEDLALNHGALSCSAAEDLVCGPAGCLRSVWQAQEDGQFLRVFLNTAQGIAAEAPGSLRFTFSGSLCGRVGAGPCEQVWSLQDGEMAPAE
ncbi:hypothetical protein [Sagittula sp.]|uniref:hypothetical protein n=1 Tax=Sagittula sp. TaxID=2038081 RepID=UPI0035189341